MPFTESNYENIILSIFNPGAGYSYTYGPDIEWDYQKQTIS